MPVRLEGTTVLVVDCQATRANPRSGHLLELGWAVAGPDADPVEVESLLVRLPPEAVVPEPVRRITGIADDERKRSVSESFAWKRLSRKALQVAAVNRAPLCPTVIHFAAFEKPFLHDLHARFGGTAPFPLQIVCTHALARRLLPGLPRKGLRAVAGFFGHPLGEHRRSRDHVRATAAVWRHLVRRLVDEQGISGWKALRAWIVGPPAARPSGRTYPMDPDHLRAIEDRPGVYRMRGRHDHLLYIGKAASLRKRVAGYFRPRATHAEHILEMLSQAFRLDCTPTATALEAALLEADEIKRSAPRYNIALRAGERRLGYCAPDLNHWAPAADAAHPVGPLPLGRTTEAMRHIGAWLRADRRPGAHPGSGLLAVPVEHAPDPDCLTAGAGLFLRRHPRAPARSPLSAILGIGGRLTLAAQGARTAGVEEEPEAPEAATGWTPETVCGAIEASIRHAALLVRRARWLCLLSESSIAWRGRGGGAVRYRVLVLERGRVRDAREQTATEAPPTPPGADRTRLGRQAIIDLAAYDRLRVLTTELRRLVAEHRGVRVRCGPRRVLDESGLRTLLRWV